MILDPPIIALLLGSILISGLVLYAAAFGVQILRHWDIKSGSERQLSLERKTYLISTIINYAFGFQLLSLFLFIYTADDLCRLFVGAMCAVGTLNVNAYGYPALILKIINFLFAGRWLILNYADNRAFDYPLIKKKYIFLLIMTPYILAETVLLFLYFLVIASQCDHLMLRKPFQPGGCGCGIEPCSLTEHPREDNILFDDGGADNIRSLFLPDGQPERIFVFAREFSCLDNIHRIANLLRIPLLL